MSALKYWDGTAWQMLAVGAGSTGPVGPPGPTGPVGPTGYEASPIGTALSWTGKTLPNGWVLADGARYTQATYPQGYDFAKAEADAGNTLWTYRTTPDVSFTVPDLREKFLLASGSTYAFGASGGEATHVLTAAESGLRAHGHGSSALRTVLLVQPRQSGGVPVIAANNFNNYSAQAGYNAIDGWDNGAVRPITGNVDNNTAVNGSAHNTMPPYVVLAQMIKVAGAVTSGGAIVGPPGPPGADGAPGTPGAAGTPGAPGPATLEVWTAPAAPAPRNDYTVWIDTDEPQATWLGPPTRVTSLPGSPVDGQEVYYVADATLGILWHLRYNAGSASAYKWECVGAPWAQSTIGGTADTPGTGSSYSTTLTDGSSIVNYPCPLGGDYEVYMSCIAQPKDSSVRNMSVGVNRSVAGTPPILGTSGASGGLFTQITQIGRFNGIGAGSSLYMYYLYGPVVFTFTSRWFFTRPIRVG